MNEFPEGRVMTEGSDQLCQFDDNLVILGFGRKILPVVLGQIQTSLDVGHNWLLLGHLFKTPIAEYISGEVEYLEHDFSILIEIMILKEKQV